MPNVKLAWPRPGLLAIAICLAGIFIRVHFYAVNRSLWADEAMLSNNILDRSFLGLLKPLADNQGAPIGFLFLQKAIVMWLGGKDYILRVLPLFAGLASLPLMWSVLRQYSQGWAPYVSLGLFALSAPVIYYSSEAKQYSSDVLVALLLLLLVPKCLDDNPKTSRLVALGVVGCLAIWFSHPALFVLGAATLTLGIAYAARRAWRDLLRLGAVGAALAASCVLAYLISWRDLAAAPRLLDYWNASFAPLPPWSHFAWYEQALQNALLQAAGLPTSAIAIGISIAGLVSIATRRWQLMLASIVPFLLSLIASALRKYPTYPGADRLLLFLVPAVMLLLGEGVERIRLLLLKANAPIAWLVPSLLVMYLLYDPAITAYNRYRFPPMQESIKPVMAFVSKRHARADQVYVYYGAGPAFRFYASQYGFPETSYVIGLSSRDDPEQYLREVDALKGHKRVWFVFSHICPVCRVNEQSFILKHLDDIGVKRTEFNKVQGASAYLYDLVQAAGAP